MRKTTGIASVTGSSFSRSTTFAMAAGTALTVSALALAALGGKRLVLTAAGGRTRWLATLRAGGRVVEVNPELGRYFDTDNLISNESSYLHAVTGLRERGVQGGVYLGVGPAQNFSYIAEIRPALAVLLDVRRDNLLQHLWLKALFQRSDNRLDYLCTMVARVCGGPSAALTIEELVARVDAAPPSPDPEQVIARITAEAGATGVPLTAADSAFIASVHRRFAAAGLDLRFNTHGRAPRSYYPTLRDLLLERDLDGRPASYLATADGYRFVAGLQRSNRVVPVVGDLGGDHALPALGRELDGRGLAVSAFYVSNVEFYLFGDGLFPRYIRNLRALPLRDDAVLIRSYFNRFRAIPQTVRGYASTQLLDSAPALLTDWEEGRVRGYRDLIARSRAR